MTPPGPTSPGLDRLNAMPAADAAAALHAVCGSRRWVEALLAARPYASASDLLERAETTWLALAPADCLEAFSHHPRIGERTLDQPRFAATAAQSAREQSGMAAAGADLRDEFERLNREYERKFGHVFLICASGRTAEDMLRHLRARLANDAPAELANARAEQAKILRLRLERMLAP